MLYVVSGVNVLFEYVFALLSAVLALVVASVAAVETAEDFALFALVVASAAAALIASFLAVVIVDDTVEIIASDVIFCSAEETRVLSELKSVCETLAEMELLRIVSCELNSVLVVFQSTHLHEVRLLPIQMAENQSSARPFLRTLFA